MFKKLLSAILAMGTILSFAVPMNANAQATNSISYRAHVSDIGWMDYVGNDQICGTTGRALQMEALKIKTSGSDDVAVQYSAHVSNIGWMDYVGNDQICGTTGKALQMEAIRIKLTGADASKYDIYYRTHIADYGWLGWSKNGEPAGSQGYAKRIEAVEIKLCAKASFSPSNSTLSFLQNFKVSYSAHVAEKGWMEYVSNGSTAGTTGMGLRMEAFKATADSLYGASLEYSAYVKNDGWTSFVGDNQIGGTTGRALPTEAVKIRLSGEYADKYDVWYRVHSSNMGWLGWAKNGAPAGTDGYGYQAEAIQIVLCYKGQQNLSGSTAFYQKTKLTYSSYINGVGWTKAENNNQCPQIINNKAISAFNSSIENSTKLGIEYSLCASNNWNEYTNGTIGTTSGEGFEKFKARLTGTDASKNDIWYRVYLNGTWTGWAKNGDEVGSDGYGYKIMAIQMRLEDKGSVSLSTANAVYQKINYYYEINNGNDKWSSSTNGQTSGTPGTGSIRKFKLTLTNKPNTDISYSAHVSNIGWVDMVNGSVAVGDAAQNIEAIKINLSASLLKQYSVYYRVYVQDKGWLGWAKNGESAGTQGMALAVQAVEVEILDNSLATKSTGNSFIVPVVTKTFALDFGHGGRDSGAIGCDGRYEANDNLKIGTEVKRILLQQGQKVFVVNRDLETHQRPYNANSSNADFFVSLHRDSSPTSSKASGITIYTHEPSHTQQIYEPEKDYAPNEYPNKHSGDDALTQNIAACLKQTPIVGFNGIHYGSASAPTYEDYYINRISNMPSCIIEVGFVSNPTDNWYFDTYYKAYAKAIAKGMMQAAGVPFNESLYTLG